MKPVKYLIYTELNHQLYLYLFDNVTSSVLNTLRIEFWQLLQNLISTQISYRLYGNIPELNNKVFIINSHTFQEVILIFISTL